MGTLDGKVAIVTGAGRGIGRGHAMLLAAEGAKVVVNDLGGSWDGEGKDERQAQLVVDEITALGGTAVANYANIATWDGGREVVTQAIDTYGQLNILVNNAGILRDKMIFNMEEADWDSVINVHLKGHFCPTHFAAKYWRECSKSGNPVTGRIINTASESGLFGNGGQANYAAAKAGIASLTIVLARELEKYGVTANAIAPRARTRMTEGSFSGDLFKVEEGKFDEWDADNIAPTVAWLCTDEAADINGQTFVVWGSAVYLMEGWKLGKTINKGSRWTVEELIAKKDEIFSEQKSSVPPMGFGLG